MISQISDYIYVGGNDLAQIQIDGGVMPLRNGVGRSAANCLRGEDLAFLDEAVCERYMLFKGSTWPTPSAAGGFDPKNFDRRLSATQLNGVVANVIVEPRNSEGVFMAPGLSFVNTVVDGSDYPDYSGLYSGFTPTFTSVTPGRILRASDLLTTFENMKNSTRGFFRYNSVSPSSRQTVYNQSRTWSQDITVRYKSGDTETEEAESVSRSLCRRWYSWSWWDIYKFGSSTSYSYTKKDTSQSTTPSSSFDSLQFATFSNLPPGAVVYPIVGCLGKLQYYHLRRSSELERDYDFRGVFHGTSKTVSSSGGSVSFTFGEVLHNGGTSCFGRMESAIEDKFDSISGRFVIEDPDYLPPESDMVWEDGTGLVGAYHWKYALTKYFDIELFGFVVDLGNHTKWWV